MTIKFQAAEKNQKEEREKDINDLKNDEIKTLQEKIIYSGQTIGRQNLPIKNNFFLRITLFYRNGTREFEHFSSVLTKHIPYFFLHPSLSLSL